MNVYCSFHSYISLKDSNILAEKIKQMSQESKSQ